MMNYLTLENEIYVHNGVIMRKIQYEIIGMLEKIRDDSVELSEEIKYLEELVKGDIVDEKE